MEEIKMTKETMPVVVLSGLCVLPGMMIHFDLHRDKSIHAAEQAMIGDQLLFLVSQKDEQVEEPAIEDIYQAGTVARLKQMSKLPNGFIRVMVEGISRAKLLSLSQQEPSYLLAEVERMPELLKEDDENRTEAMLRELRQLFHAYGTINPKITKMLETKLVYVKEPGRLIDLITGSIPLSVESKQRILAAETLQEKYDCLSDTLSKEIQIGQIRKELSAKIQQKVNKNQKEYLLKEQLNAIREELGDKDSYCEAEQFEEAAEQIEADAEVMARIKKEIARFKSLSVSSSESAVERAYIETLLELPWNKTSKDNTDINRASKILEEDHYGLKQVKERILEFLAVRSLTKAVDSPIVCLVGPPGTGKTSIAKSVARALQKEYVRISLGGVRDEAEIRGHRKTYVGAMPGRIATGLKQAGVMNPLMLLDEIDKMSSDYKGDPSAALLEVLDGEQNNRFRDHYVEVPIDLSQVLFIATANETANIPRPLLDRMEIIQVSSYTENEKFHIAKNHLLKKAFEKNGMTDGRLSITDGALKAIVAGYTREAGVRGLERRLGEVCRKAAKELLEKPQKQRVGMTIRVTAQNLEKYLGKVKYTREEAGDKEEIGIANGLAWTSVGGEILQIEVNMMPGKGELELTGQMGDVMKESAITSLSYVRSVSKSYRIAPELFKENDFHIHIPEGAVPKDGPSAGITMATALMSAIINKPVCAGVAMTGEITLRGRVLPIGGLKEKLLAAKMAGIRQVLVPIKNRKDVEEISTEIKAGMEICFVERMEEVLEKALVS